MKNIIIFDTSSGSQNMGDYIINESIDRELGFLIDNNFTVHYATHTPITHFYQNLRKNPVYNFCDKADYKFLAGTNAIQYNMIRPWANLNINRFNCKSYKNTILVGVGVNPNSSKMNHYTKSLFKSILSKDYVHSVRDERTKQLLNSLGFKAENTGCATLWMLTKDHCAQIKKEKSSNVIFTLTDYEKDSKKDQELINILNNNYKKIYYWVQGSEDLEYLNSLKNTENIVIVGPNLKSYKKVLLSGDIDYVGTRLHAGVYAMQHKVRSIILAIDNRARDMKKTYNLVAIERDKIANIEELIHSRFSTDIRIDEKKINDWKAQFGD